MKKIILLLILVVIFLSGCTQNQNSLSEKPIVEMKLTSSAFDHNKQIPSKYTCYGQDLIPPLSFGNVPEGAKSLVLIMDDPDAQRVVGKTIDHWVIFNIPPEISGNEEGSEPFGIDGKNSKDLLGYMGPCPPINDEHRYVFRLYALDTKLNLPEGATKEQVKQAMEGHIIGLGRLVGRYEGS